jgi:hypothetical protein
MMNLRALPGAGLIVCVAAISLVSTACSDKTTGTGTQYDRTYIRDAQYLRNRYFWIFDPFSADSVWAHRVQRGDSIVTCQLYRTARYDVAPISPQGLCVPEIPPGLTISVARSQPDSVYSEFQRIENLQLIKPTDYYADGKQFWLTIGDHAPINEGVLLGVYMEIQTPSGVDTLGQLSADTTATPDSISLILTMIKSDNKQYPGSPTWNLEWKNVYDLGVRGIAAGALSVDVRLGIAGTEGQWYNPNQLGGTPLIEILGLDRTSADGSPVPDGIVDDSPAVLDLVRGHLLFPNSFPFAPSSYPDTSSADIVHPILGDQATYARNGTRLVPEAAGIYSGPTQINRQEASEYYLVITTRR